MKMQNGIKELYKNKVLKIITELVNEYEIEERVCPNQFVGTVELEGGKFKWKEGKSDISSLKRSNEKLNSRYSIDQSKNKRIVIVLESPHKHEYRDQGTGPAMGVTGKNLDKNLIDILNLKGKILLNSIEDNKDYDIIFVNAIQYQASLGIDTEVFRDRLWLEMWLNLNKREDFIEELKRIKPVVIFNLCTNGSHNKDIIAIMDSEKRSGIGYEYIESICVGKISKDKHFINMDKKNLCKAKYDKKGNEYYTLRSFVNNAIFEAVNDKNIDFINAIVFEGRHPSSWGRRELDIDTEIIYLENE